MSANCAYEELRVARLWDGRCRTTLVNACKRLADQSNVLSSALGSCRKAVSHILHHKKVTASDLLGGHIAATVSRVKKQDTPLVLVASDTMVCDFTCHKAVTGLGPITDKSHKSRGFLVHSALALTTEGVPLGLLYQESWARDPERSDPAKPLRQREYTDKESHKWLCALRGWKSHFPNRNPPC
jgi:hypothetical protein